MRPLGNVLDKIRGSEDGPKGDNISQRKGGSKDDVAGSTKRLPILIFFPGFMSSALEVEESPDKAWVDKRVWLSVASAGFSSIYVGSALESNEYKKDRGEEYDEELDSQYQRELECKNQWLRHLKLSDDLQSDPSGIKTRPMHGLEGAFVCGACGASQCVCRLSHRSFIHIQL